MPPIFSIEKREEIKTKLLEKGVDMIKNRGIKKMTVDDISESAGIGKGTFYHFFESKEAYVYEVIMFSKEKILNFINKAIEEKGGIDKQTLFNMLQTFSFTSKNNIISFMTKEDEDWLKNKLPEKFEPNPKQEEHIADFILGHAIGAKPNINNHFIINMIKIMAMTAESSSELYQDTLDENMSMMINMLCNYIYED